MMTMVNVESRLQQLIASQHTPYQPLFDAARYALFSGGKRLRPQLTLATCELLGADPELALNPACAIEMIHTYSMIHDDLPCMDDDDFRRGKPTVHRAFSEGLAVLAGDYLLTVAFEILADAPGLDAQQRIELVKVASQVSGAHGMIGGQVMDLANEGRAADAKTLQTIHELKTGALIQGSVTCGAIAARASTEQLQQLRLFSEAIGLAYQIVDDIIDVTHSEAKHGKAKSSDLAHAKMTYVSCLGVQGAQAEAERQLEKAINLLHGFSGNADSLRNLAQRMVHRSR